MIGCRVKDVSVEMVVFDELSFEIGCGQASAALTLKNKEEDYAMRRIMLLLVFAVLMISLAGCAGTVAQQRTMPDGTVVTTGSKTDAFGNNNSWVEVRHPANPAEPAYIQVEDRHTISETSWTGCPDKEPNKRAKNIKRREVVETQQKSLPNPKAQGGKTSFGFGDNPGPGDSIIPAVLNAGSRLGAAAIRGGGTPSVNVSASGGKVGNVDSQSRVGNIDSYNNSSSKATSE